MAIDRYESWEPVKGVHGRFKLEGLHDDYEFVRLILRESSENGDVLRLVFDTAPIYRNINESYRASLWSNSEVSNRSFFTVIDSSWLEFLKNESGGTFDPADWTHYAILTMEDCVDIASRSAPIAEWLSK